MKSTFTPVWFRIGLGLALVMSALPTWSYPPAPYHLIYGVVRDEMGNPLNVDSGTITLEAMTGTKISAYIIPGLEPGVNYQLKVPMDAGMSDDLYKPTALRPTVPFLLRVHIKQKEYLPIEMRGDYTYLGQPGQKTRIDLTLGEDSDSDGIPDAWERALLAMSGGNNTNLAAINPQDDFDGDGLSNLAEYISGNYAFDSQNGFSLKMLGLHNGRTQLEFMAIRGRTYTVYSSVDFWDWTPVKFQVPAQDNVVRDYYYATDIRILQIEVVSPVDQPVKRFFKLIVQ